MVFIEEVLPMIMSVGFMKLEAFLRLVPSDEVPR
jgi:hypothetical protein